MCFVLCVFVCCFWCVQARERAASVAEQAAAEVANNPPMLLAEPIHYSDPAALLNRG